MRRSIVLLALAATAGCKTSLDLPGTSTVTNAISRAQAPLAPSGPLTVPAMVDSKPVQPASYTPVVVPPVVVPPPVLGESLHYTQVKVVASIGHDAVITEDEVLQCVRSRIFEYGNLTGEARAAKEKQIYREELQLIIGRELIILELFDRMKKNKAEDRIEDLKKHAEEQAEKEIAERKKRQGLASMSESDFVKMLEREGTSYKGFKRQITQENLAQIYLEQTIKDKVKFISLNDLWDYYQAHPKDFAIEDKVKWLDLFVSFRSFPTQEQAKEHADKAWRAAMAGGDFVELVKKYGQGDSNLRAGEGIGTKRGEVQPAEIEPVLMEMSAGQVSPLLQTATGYHIVKVVERVKAGTIPFDEKVQSFIRFKLEALVRQKEKEKVVEELWRRYLPKVVEQN